MISLKKVSIAPWDKWNARDFLNEYFIKVGPESAKTYDFIIKMMKKIKHPIPVALDVGSGPTLFGAIPITKYVNEIHLSDFVNDNLLEIQKWVEEDINSFNWNAFTKKALILEGYKGNKKNIQNRENILRKKIKKIVKCDLALKSPLTHNKKYPLVLSMFCPDSATDSKIKWGIYMENMLNLLEPTSTILIASLRKCKYYKNGRDFFPCANIDENDLKKLLVANGFKKENLTIKVVNVPECKIEGFTSIILVCASKIKRM